MESTEAPVFQLSEEISGANTLCQVELSLPVETKNILEYLGGAVEIELSGGEVVGIAQGRDLSCGVLLSLLLLRPNHCCLTFTSCIAKLL